MAQSIGHLPKNLARRGFLRLGGAAGVAAATSTLGGCSPLSLVNDWTPRESFTLRDGLAFGPGPRDRLDLYLPSVPRPGAPLVVFFYGGAWTSGNRGDYLFAAEALTSRGYAAALPDYRLHPEVRFPGFIDDGARALRWLVREGWAKDGIALAGHSAGAYNAAMLAFAAQWRSRWEPGTRLRGFAGLAGPYDFLPLTGRTTRAVFGWPDTPRSTQPIEHVDATAPPALLITAERDSLVDPGNSRRLAAKLRAFDRPVEERVYPQLDHRTVVGVLARLLRDRAPVLDDLDRFLSRLA